jgi:hypothetical protein
MSVRSLANLFACLELERGHCPSRKHRRRSFDGSVAKIEELRKGHDFSHLRSASEAGLTIAEIVLYHFFKFVYYGYGMGNTKVLGTTVKDVYGPEVAEECEGLIGLCLVFRARESAKKN